LQDKKDIIYLCDYFTRKQLRHCQRYNYITRFYLASPLFQRRFKDLSAERA